MKGALEVQIRKEMIEEFNLKRGKLGIKKSEKIRFKPYGDRLLASWNGVSATGIKPKGNGYEVYFILPNAENTDGFDEVPIDAMKTY